MSAPTPICERCDAPLPGGDEAGFCPACAIARAFGLDKSETDELVDADLLAGRYRLGETLGEGGFGVVYDAEQLVPVKRRIAVKLIKPGMASPEIVARFEAERQALALLDHPGIAKILDAGETEDGQPFFAMELVEGKPITDHCAEAGVDERGRLELFAKACDAIGYAHREGIIHRDIKPSNILVTADGEVKVIDFGVAKATRHVLTEATLLTGLHQFIGTPAYVSPEQAETSGRDIDARSDVYSLGAVLYELLTGRAPFETSELNDLGLGELLQHLREKIPPSPGCGGDLSRVTMRALAKDPSDRHATAAELAEDVRKALGGEPIAKPMRERGRGRKTAAIAVGAAIVAGFVFPKIARKNEPSISIAALDQLYDEGHAAPHLAEQPASVLEDLAQRYLRAGRHHEAREALLLAVAKHASGSPAKLQPLSLLGELAASDSWIGRERDGPHIIEAAELAREHLGDKSVETARCIARYNTDLGLLLGIKETGVALRAALVRAKLAAAPPEAISILNAAIAEHSQRQKERYATAEQHYDLYQNAADKAMASHYLRRSAYWLTGTGDVEAGLDRMAEAERIGAETELSFDIQHRHDLAAGWIHWRAGDLDAARSRLEMLVERDLLDSRLPSMQRASALRNLYRVAWDEPDAGASFWSFIDAFEDRTAGTIWPTDEIRVLLPRRSRWAYSHQTTAPPISWATTAPLPSRGHAPFNDYTGPSGCRLPWPSKDSPATTYFRTQFEIDDPDDFGQLKVRLTRWTGAAVYLNGSEIVRDNLSTTARHDTLASKPEQGGQMRALVFVVDAGALVAGENTISVEVHRYGSGAHRYFDLQLEGRKSF